MKNNKSLIAVLAVIAAVVIGGSFLMFSGSDKGREAVTGYGTSKKETKMPEKSTPAASTANAVEADAVKIADYKFGPDTIKVKVGTKVTWTNTDAVKHNISPDSPTGDFKAGDLFGKDASYSFTFSKAGTFKYHCDPHPYMHGTVVVTE